MKNFISAQDLKNCLNDSNLIIVDTRFNLQDPTEGHKLFKEAHIPGAVYFDLDKDLSSPPQAHGGRHPLPEVDGLVRKLELAGIGDDTTVAIYDDTMNVFAGRMWWLLKFLGHDDVKVLDGGLSAWQEAGFDTTAELPHREAATFTPRPNPEMIADMGEVKRKLGDSSTVLIDSRGAERYRGDEEPLDKKAGHIPSAQNIPFAGNYKNGKLKDKDALEERFANASEAEEVIVYCGSGVSAANNLLALEEVGVVGAKLYVGSWSDWSSYEDTPVETGGEE